MLVPLVYRQMVTDPDEPGLVVFVLGLLRPCLLGELSDELYQQSLGPGLTLVGPVSEKMGFVPLRIVVEPEKASRAPYGVLEVELTPGYIVYVHGNKLRSIGEIVRCAMAGDLS